jgi:ketosteroid isomerase-like protein
MTDTLDDRADSNRQIIREAFDAWQAGTARVTDVRDGNVVDGTAFFDSISFNDLWTRVEP